MGHDQTGFRIRRSENKLVLQGGLDGQNEVREECLRAMIEARNTGLKNFVVDATATAVVAAGVTIWIEVLKQNLFDTTLRYIDSQLAQILQFDSRHKDIHATFDPNYLNTDMPPLGEQQHVRQRKKVAFG